jgi:hypothetical protein
MSTKRASMRTGGVMRDATSGKALRRHADDVSPPVRTARHGTARRGTARRGAARHGRRRTAEAHRGRAPRAWRSCRCARRG